MRTFRDRDGTEWTVWLVRPSVSLDGGSPPGAHRGMAHVRIKMKGQG